MDSRKTEAIRLKARGRGRASEVSGMLAELEGKTPPRRSKSRSALWTREFLASGKPGKTPG
jgi:hypothetical protein